MAEPNMEQSQQYPASLAAPGGAIWVASQPEMARVQQEQRPAKPFYKRPILMIVLGLIVLGGLIWGVRWWLHSRQYVSTDDAFIDGHIVQISPKVAGYVTEVFVDDNQRVKVGDPLLAIDPRDYKVALEKAKADEAAARGQLEQAEAQLAAAQANARAAEAEVAAALASATYQAQELARNERLFRTNSASRESLEAAVASARSATANLTSTKAKATAAQTQIAVSRSQITTARAAIQQAQAQVHQAQLNLSYTRINAPVAGRVTRKSVERGDYVTVGQQLLALVEPQIWVTANFRETRLSELQVGQPVEISVDAFPGRTFRGHVESFQKGTGARFSLLPPENATGNYVKVVQRIPVKIVFDEPVEDLRRLGPGMSVVPEVKVQ